MKNKFKIVFVSIFLVFAVLLNACTPQTAPTVSATPVAPATPSTLSAMLSEITGKVEIKQIGQDTFAPAETDSFLDEDGQLLTGDDGRVRLDLSTGTIVRVAPASLFTLTANKPVDGSLKTRLELTLGQIFIILNGGSMEVETPTGTAAVRGSYMSVIYDSNSGEIRITCLEGNCSLSNASGSVEITAGQTAVITGIGQPPQIGKMSDQDIQDWLNNNPEAELVVTALTEELVATEIPAPTDAPPTQVAPTEVVIKPPLVIVPPIIKRFVEPEEPASITVVPIIVVPTPAPSLVPTVVISNVTPTSSVVGEPLTLMISVLPSAGGPLPTGTVKVVVNGSPICAASLSATGTASCIGGVSVAGLFDLVANYYGDSNYLTAQTTLSGYMVGKASTTTTITSQTPYPSLVSTAVVFVATVDNVAPGAGLPTGSVIFSDGTDSCTVTSAPWTCSVTFTNSGPRLVTASYSGDVNFNGSLSASVTQDVLTSVNSEFLNIVGPISIALANNTECSQPYSVKVLDVDGVNEVKMEYSINDDTFSSPGQILLTNMGANTWQGTIVVPAVSLDTIFWRYIAVDGALNSIFFGGTVPYTNGYPGGPVSSYYFSLISTFAPPCVP